jgi:nitrite reductase/ring-hydroxylating ferredoxin subunit
MASVVGTVIEWYDFFIYGAAAAIVFNQLFFPEFAPLTGTMAAFGTYALGFFARPFYGLPNVCPHQTGPLCEGKPPLGILVSRAENDWRFEWVHDGEVVVCPWHGLEYHVPTGGCLAYPNINLRRYEVFVESGEVKVLL